MLVPSFRFVLNYLSAHSWLCDFGPVPSLVVPLEAVTGEGGHYTEVTVWQQSLQWSGPLVHVC